MIFKIPCIKAAALLFFCIVASNQTFGLTCSELRQLTTLYFRMHYSYNHFTDEISKRALENFTKAWDPGKIYFFKSDIDQLTAKYANKLDDQVKANNCGAIDEIISLYSKRFQERQKHVHHIINQKHDFTVDEYMIVDREKLTYAKTPKEINERLRKRIKFQLLSLISSLEDPKVAKDKLKKRYDLAMKRHNEITKDKVYGIFLNAFSTALDPHTSYMAADDLEDFRIRTRLSLEGIGASLRSEDGFTIVISLVKGGAAEKGGLLKVNDKITAVAQADGEPVDVIDMDLQEVVKKIRGARGTVVKLSIIREEANAIQKLVIPIVREKIQLLDQQASSRIIEVDTTQDKSQKMPKYRIGVITLPSFYIDFESRNRKRSNYRSSSMDTKREIQKLKKDGVDAIIVDLRSNGGGSLEESINVAGLFFDKGPVVQVKSQTGQIEPYSDQDGITYYDGPLAVMINRHSASASEIFAGAIQDYQRGIIVGDSHTFGKGTVQNLNDVAAKLGAVKVTVNKFYRASGASTQLHGVEADIRLPSLVDEYEIGEKFYDYALPFETIPSAPYQKFNSVKPFVKQLITASEHRIKTNPDFQKVFEEIEKFRKNTDERSRVSLKEKPKADDSVKEASKKDEKEALVAIESKKAEMEIEADESNEFKLQDDIYLQEALKITADYIHLLSGKPLGNPTIIELLAEKKGESSDKKRKSK